MRGWMGGGGSCMRGWMGGGSCLRGWMGGGRGGPV